jgi:hypothetical protein
MISILISLLILVLVFGVAFYILTLLPLPPPFGLVAQLILGLIFLLVVLGWLLPLAGVYPWYGPVR